MDRAVATGLRCRPLSQTVADTWAWLVDAGDVTPTRRLGLDAAKERAALTLQRRA